MRITKFAHACLLVEEAGVCLLTDPGFWNGLPEVEALDAILITHTHQDHLDIAQVKALLEKHPNATVITHAEAGAMLTEAGIPFTLIQNGETVEVKGVSVESCGTSHAHIYGELPKCQNTGYFIAKKLFVPGDALHDIPSTQVSVLALPTGGPWMRISEAIDYAKKINPKVAFPIHDALYTKEYRAQVASRWFGGTLKDAGIIFEDFSAGPTLEV